MNLNIRTETSSFYQTFFLGYCTATTHTSDRHTPIHTHTRSCAHAHHSSTYVLATAEDCQIDAQFQGFQNNTFLQYGVLDTELNNEAELVVLDRLNATEQLINRHFDDLGDMYMKLEGVSDT